jgi:signal transduction histidine kinase
LSEPTRSSRLLGWLGVRKLPDPPAAAAALASAHSRFARAAIGIYTAAAITALGVAIALLVTDLSHEQEQLREGLRRQVEQREDSLRRHLATLVQELRRLGLRSEVDLLDQNLSPEKGLLELSHRGSSFFNLGVAIVDARGLVMWTEPQNFLPAGASFAREAWFDSVRASRVLRIVPVDAEGTDNAILYVVSPIIRNRQFVGALVGAVDLARDSEMTTTKDWRVPLRTVLAARDGRTVYPSKPPAYSGDAAWRRIVADGYAESSVSSLTLDGHRSVVALANLGGTDLVLGSIADEDALYAGARNRARTRLILAFLLALLPFVALISLLRRSLKIFRAASERAMREERLRRVGEAANLIAHEVKNGLNGIRMAAEMTQDQSAGNAALRERALGLLRSEIDRLSSFTSHLMTFSRGIVPRQVEFSMNDLVQKVSGLMEQPAREIGAELRIDLPEPPLIALADPQLIHVVISNLLTNAIEALSTKSDCPEPRITVELRPQAQSLELTVSDNGPGLDPRMPTRLFEPFESGKASGVGIGLALSKRIANAHGGELAFSQRPIGAAFVLTLPRVVA